MTLSASVTTVVTYRCSPNAATLDVVRVRADSGDDPRVHEVYAKPAYVVFSREDVPGGCQIYEPPGLPQRAVELPSPVVHTSSAPWPCCSPSAGAESAAADATSPPAKILRMAL